ncbi:Wzz/FepE/Etk N-terminal domain-containing protein [Bacillus sp. DTU_2020_1000418_1_SI_GHA_SEK_038]|uniref:YveK family protein n=1 Tax=Bacillus sp. DTU_2020_1000418_1_SI_GHA_SEK_038 TaxID=3077585 RepID=UPI0028E3BE42|nr:Wzz/FepE/Etk N-terminal domain-containing protein [Bacillus sp. DTU_2020_1000418_1_SI_GHA_SEK_038]WNS74831.1 Wzz/FepE/Etk N-terminal domain-containing protein [Bacillus sp. DTU_2020_1000418_1_SI_GHA_SEK_038]
MQENIQIQDIINIIKKRVFLIVCITSLSVLISGVVSYFWLTPIYESSTQLLINQKKTDQQSGNSINVQENLELINTYRVIIKSPVILDLVRAEMNLDRSVKELSEQVSISSEQNSQVVTITVEDPEPKVAVEIANSIASVFMNEIQNIMNIDNVTILSLANEESSSEPVKPRLILNMLITFTLSLLMVIGLIFLFEYLDDTIKSEQDIKLILELPVLGSIPKQTVRDFEKENKKKSDKMGRKNLWGFWHSLGRKKK